MPFHFTTVGLSPAVFRLSCAARSCRRCTPRNKSCRPCHFISRPLDSHLRCSGSAALPGLVVVALLGTSPAARAISFHDRWTLTCGVPAQLRCPVLSSLHSSEQVLPPVPFHFTTVGLSPAVFRLSCAARSCRRCTPRNKSCRPCHPSLKLWMARHSKGLQLKVGALLCTVIGIHRLFSLTFIVKRSAKQASLSKRVTSPLLHHRYATHILEKGLKFRTVRAPLSHRYLDTTCTHTLVMAAPGAGTPSPLDALK